jgi:hypothetical protein
MNTALPFKSNWTPLLVLGMTSLICSRTLFFLFDDPEGPNLLIVAGMAVFMYAASLAAYLPYSPASGLKRLAAAFLVQVLLVAGLYFLLR